MQVYTWESLDLSLTYPAAWDSAALIENQLTLAQILAGDDSLRPPGAQVIRLLDLTSLPYPDDLLTPLYQALAAQNTPVGDTPIPARLLDEEAFEATGLSADGQLFGIGRAVWLGTDRALIVTGRTAAESRASFLHTFDRVTLSLARGGLAETVGGYQVLWYASQLSDGQPLGSVHALAAGNGRVFASVDGQGLVELDALTGEILAVTADDALARADDLAVAEDGTLYAAVTACGCVVRRVFEQSAVNWQDGFGSGAPYSLALLPDGVLAVTDQHPAGVQLRLFDGGEEQILTMPTNNQPDLMVNREGRLLALTRHGVVLSLGEAGFNPAFSLAAPLSKLAGADIDLHNRLVLGTDDQAIIVIDSAGQFVERLGSVVPNNPQPGEISDLRALAVGADGTVYYADANGQNGTITALSQRAAPERGGSRVLVENEVVQGRLDAQTGQQAWTYRGHAGEVVRFGLEPGGLTLRLHILAPDGAEIGSGEDVLELSADGEYTLVVERLDGDDSYRLGVDVVDRIVLDDRGVGNVSGRLSDALPVQVWRFNGRTGQVVTVTMQTTSGPLDPLLRLMRPDGALVAENDDTFDAAMGVNAQIARVRLPADGVYEIEAGRFEGSGRYSLVVVMTAGS